MQDRDASIQFHGDACGVFGAHFREALEAFRGFPRLFEGLFEESPRKGIRENPVLPEHTPSRYYQRHRDKGDTGSWLWRVP
jgi:hypothetical protein